MLKSGVSCETGVLSGSIHTGIEGARMKRGLSGRAPCMSGQETVCAPVKGPKMGDSCFTAELQHCGIGWKLGGGRKQGEENTKDFKQLLSFFALVDTAVHWLGWEETAGVGESMRNRKRIVMCVRG